MAHHNSNQHTVSQIHSQSEWADWRYVCSSPSTIQRRRRTREAHPARLNKAAYSVSPQLVPSGSVEQMQEDGRRSVEQHAALYVCSVSGPTSHTNSCSGIKLLRLHSEWEEKKHVSLLMGQDYWRWGENIRLCVIVFKSRPPSIFMKKSSAVLARYISS